MAGFKNCKNSTIYYIKRCFQLNYTLLIFIPEPSFYTFLKPKDLRLDKINLQYNYYFRLHSVQKIVFQEENNSSFVNALWALNAHFL